MVNFTIDGKKITVEDNTTIMGSCRAEWDSDSALVLSERN